MMIGDTGSRYKQLYFIFTMSLILVISYSRKLINIDIYIFFLNMYRVILQNSFDFFVNVKIYRPSILVRINCKLLCRVCATVNLQNKIIDEFRKKSRVV